MGRLRCVRCGWVIITILLLQFLAACGGSKPAGASPFPATITLNPATSASMQVGSTMVFTASARNALNTLLSTTFTYSLTTTSPTGILDISPAGVACAGNWNPTYNVCTPAGVGIVEVVATALGATSPPTLVFVHPPIDSIQISVVPPVNSPPPACPSQVALPAACQVPFNAGNCTTKVNSQGVPYYSCTCLSQNQTETLQATAFGQGVDITASVGPFTWSQSNPNVVKITPITTSSANVPTNQATVVSNTPGATEVVASASGVASQPYLQETCPVQCIALNVGANATQNVGQTSFITNKGTSQTLTATAVDVQGCIVPKPTLTWISSSPAALTAGSTCTGTGCTIGTPQQGAAALTASCVPPTCNVGFPLYAPGLPSLYFPQPIYSVTPISGLVTGAAVSTSVIASSQDCFSNDLCTVALYDVSTSKNLEGNPTAFPTPPNSLIFDPAGDKVYVGSEYGALLVTSANLGSTSANPFTTLPAPGTLQGLVTGKVLAVSPNGSVAIFSDTVSTPNQVYIVSNGNSTTALNINSATAASFAPDNSKAFILGNGGNTLYVYSPLQALQTFALTAPAKAIAFSSTGAFAFIAGGNPAANVTIRNTCDNSLASLSITGLPATPTFLKMIPAGNTPMGNPIIPSLQQSDLDNLDVFFGIDNSGIDVIATTSITPVNPPPAALCPQQQIGLAKTTLGATFNPIHIDLQYGTFQPINFFVSPDSTKVYIVTSDKGVLVYSFSTQSVSSIQLNGGAAPLAADMTVDGTLLYVAGTDGVLHELNTLLALDEMEIPFTQLANSSNNFCYESYSCSLNLVAIKP